MVSFNRPSRLGLFLLQFPLAVSAFFRMECIQPVLIERTDPIVSPGQFGGHLHAFVGPNTLNPLFSYEDSQGAKCSTYRVKADRSAYWTPTLHFMHGDGSFESVPHIGGMTIYYFFETGSDGRQVQAFPKGFQMVAGNAMARSLKEDRTHTGMRIHDKAFTFYCLKDYSQKFRNSNNMPAVEASSRKSTGFPKGNCAGGLRLEVFFPSCWDGVNLKPAPSSMSGMVNNNHVTYPSEVRSGDCPPSHPIRLPSLLLEAPFDINSFVERGFWAPSYEFDDKLDKWIQTQKPPSNPFPFILSTGDPTGYSNHADFINGWTSDILQQAINHPQCNNAPQGGSGMIEDCPVFNNLIISHANAQECKLEKGFAFKDEVYEGRIPSLPGCNPITYGPEDAPMETNCGALTGIIPPPGSKPPPRRRPHRPSKPAPIRGRKPHTELQHLGFDYVGCLVDLKNTLAKLSIPSRRTFTRGFRHEPRLTLEFCAHFCLEKGAPIMAVTDGTECLCGGPEDLPVDAICLPDKKGGVLQFKECAMPCAGNPSQKCGGYHGKLAVYKVKGFEGDIMGKKKAGHV